MDGEDQAIEKSEGEGETNLGVRRSWGGASWMEGEEG